jgi:uncharacterized protein YndB with AHSA1/START domain
MSPTGSAIAEVEPWPGGRLAITMVGGGRRIEHTGTYREIVPGRRLVFTWQSPFTGPSPSVVTVELAERDGQTELTLTHEALPTDAVESHEGGWGQILDRLAATLADAAVREVPT